MVFRELLLPPVGVASGCGSANLCGAVCMGAGAVSNFAAGYSLGGSVGAGGLEAGELPMVGCVM